MLPNEVPLQEQKKKGTANKIHIAASSFGG
jgi:hypothetical protein